MGVGGRDTGQPLSERALMERLVVARDEHALLGALEGTLGASLAFDRHALTLNDGRYAWADPAGAGGGQARLAPGRTSGGPCEVRPPREDCPVEAGFAEDGFTQLLRCPLEGAGREPLGAYYAAYRVASDREAARQALDRLRPLLSLAARAVAGGFGAAASPEQASDDLEEDLESLDARMRHSEKLWAIGQLVGGVAHELNNPLTGILGFAEMLLLEERPPDDREALERIEFEARRAARIVKDLLTFSRQHRAERTYADLNEVIERTVSLRAYELRLGGIAFQLSLERSLPKTLLDVHKVQQVVMNLVVNAEQAIRETGGTGRIEVITDQHLGRLRLRVRDDGPGVAKEDLPKLFVPFYTTRGVGAGTGLGLSTSYGIVREHGGQIELSRNPGRGMTATVLLPIEAPEEIPAESPRAPLTLAPSERRVLVVDDDEAVAGFLRAALERFGHEVDTAPTAEDALVLCAERTYNALLVDIRMPGMGGIGLYKALEARHPDLARRVVFQAGDSTDPETATFVRTSGRPMLAKPYTLDDVTRMIARVAVGGTG